jgi:uncharacterized membrane protein
MVRGHRALAAVFLIVAGAAVAAATWASGAHGWAIGVLAAYAVLATLAFLWAGGSGDIAAILRVSGDERQRGLDRDATAITGVVMSLAAIVGGIVQIARTGSPGVYGLFCVIGGVAYAASLFELRRRQVTRRPGRASPAGRSDGA